MLRDLVLRLLPAGWRASAEAESRDWGVTCTGCGRRSSLWDLGGLRWKAAGRPVMVFRCPHCGARSVAPVIRRSRNPPGDA